MSRAIPNHFYTTREQFLEERERIFGVMFIRLNLWSYRL